MAEAMIVRVKECKKIRVVGNRGEKVKYPVHWPGITLLTKIMLHLRLQTHAVTMLPDLGKIERTKKKILREKRARGTDFMVAVTFLLRGEKGPQKWYKG